MFLAQSEIETFPFVPLSRAYKDVVSRILRYSRIYNHLKKKAIRFWDRKTTICNKLTLKTSCTVYISSGPTPSPGMTVHFVLPSNFFGCSLHYKQLNKYIKIIRKFESKIFSQRKYITNLSFLCPVCWTME